MKKHIVCLYLLFCVFTSFTQELTASFNSPEDSTMMSLVRLWAEEVEKLTGVTFLIESMPLRRADKRLREGLLDVEFGRVDFLYENDVNVIYTDFPVFVSHYIIYTRQTSINPHNAETFRELRLVVVRGNKVTERWTRNENIKNYIEVDDSETALLMVNFGRADYFIGRRLFCSYLESNIELSNINILDQSLFDIPYYLAFNRKHKDLVPLISAAMEELCDSGRTAEILLTGNFSY